MWLKFDLDGCGRRVVLRHIEAWPGTGIDANQIRTTVTLAILIQGLSTHGPGVEGRGRTRFRTSEKSVEKRDKSSGSAIQLLGLFGLRFTPILS